MPNIKQFCDNCRFYLPTEDDGKGRGECRRYPRQCSDSGDIFRRYFSQRFQNTIGVENGIRSSKVETPLYTMKNNHCSQLL